MSPGSKGIGITVLGWVDGSGLAGQPTSTYRGGVGLISWIVVGLLAGVAALRKTVTSWRFYDGFRTDAQAPARQPCVASPGVSLDMSPGSFQPSSSPSSR